ncbi:MAG: hypothetical protein Q8Q01_03185 [archaeon]|nr:hypothetical protein [archaeon]
MDIRRVRTCEKCKTSVPLSRVRLMPKNKDASMLVCDECCSAMQTARSQNPPKKPIRNIPANVEKRQCTRCNYSFRISTTRLDLQKPVCPYCGKDDRVTNRTEVQKQSESSLPGYTAIHRRW